MADRKKRSAIGTLQPKIDSVLEWNELTPEEFSPASWEERGGQTSPRQASYWGRIWRQLRRDAVAMAALGVLVLLLLFAFVGPVLVPYEYDQFNKGAENLHPTHYTLEEQERFDQATQSADPEAALAQARAIAGAKGETLSRREEAMVRAAAKAGGDYAGLSEREVYTELGIRPHLFGYSREELQHRADGEGVFPHVFGTDKYGRDLMVRAMYATRISMLIGVAAALIVLVIGALYGAISGYCGGRVDLVMQRVVDIIYSLPEVLVILLLATALGPHIEQFIANHSGNPIAACLRTVGPNLAAMFLCFALLYWVGMSRIIRAQILTLKNQEFVLAARALGASGWRIIRRHLLPNCMGQIVVTTCLQIPSAIFLESFLSYLGVGVAAPLASLGSMCRDALSGLTTYTYRLIIPSVIISLMILSFNLLGDGLRDALDPRPKKEERGKAYGAQKRNKGRAEPNV